MADGSTLHRFRIELEDHDRRLERSLDLRIPRHPSETEPYLLGRVIAYCYLWSPAIALSRGVCVGDEPDLWVGGAASRPGTWIEVGSPGDGHLARAVRRADQVHLFRIGCSPRPAPAGVRLHELPPGFLEPLVRSLGRTNRWQVAIRDRELSVSTGESSVSTALGARD